MGCACGYGVHVYRRTDLGLVDMGVIPASNGGIEPDTIRFAALQMAGRWTVDDLLNLHGLDRLDYGTRTWHLVRDLVDEGAITRHADGYYEVRSV